MTILTDINRFSAVIIALLGRQVVYVAIAFLMIAVLTKVLRLRSPYWHIGLWSLVLIRLLLPPGLASPISGRALFDRVVPFDAVYDRVEHFLLPIIAPQVDISVPQPRAGISDEMPRPAPRPSWHTIAFACWLLGVGGCAELYARKRSRYRALIYEARPVEDAEILSLLRDCCAQFQVARPVRVVTSNTSISPFTFGVVHPVIYVPQHLLHADNMTALYAIIAHELIHIKRYDIVWMNLQNIIQIIFFFFPVVWYVNRQIELARECICDRAVVAGGTISTRQYGSSLLLVLKLCFTNQEPLQFLPSFNAQYRILKQRIQRLNTYARQKTPHSHAMYAVLLLFGTISLPMAPETTGITFFTPFEEADRQAFQTFQQRVVKPYSESYSATLTSMRYTGVGLQGEFGETVYAIGAGEVVRITGEAPHTEVVVAHALSRRTRIFSVYARINDVRVRVGDMVTEETPIGRMLNREEYAASGFSEQRLHLEVRQTLNAYRSRSPHYLKYENPEILESNFINPVIFYRKHLQS